MTTAINARHARPPVRRSPSWLARCARLIRAAMSRLRTSRLAWASGLIRLAVFLLVHPSAPVPGGLLNVRVPEAPRDIRVGLLEGMAYGYGTETFRRFGMTVVERRFGPVRVEAHLKDDDYTAQLAARMGTAGIEAAA